MGAGLFCSIFIFSVVAPTQKQLVSVDGNQFDRSKLFRPTDNLQALIQASKSSKEHPIVPLCLLFFLTVNRQL